jgi:hypothetical protein
MWKDLSFVDNPIRAWSHALSLDRRFAMGVKDVVEEFEAFAGSLEESKVAELGLLANGFEGWLKVEWYISMKKKFSLAPGREIGLEYSVALDRRRSGMDIHSKRCDLWVRSADPAETYHYVELKAPFDNQNSTKMLDSAGYDAWYLSRMRRGEQAATGTAIVLGVGYEDLRWAEAVERVRSAAGFATEYAVQSHRIGPSVRWCAFTHDYR